MGITSNFQKRAERGQSLVEFTLVLPIFILILVAAGYIGIAIYQGNMASDAIREPTIRKMEMANERNAVSGGQLMGYISGSPLGGTINLGSKIDSVNVVNGTNAAIIVGRKAYNPPVSFIPSFNFAVAQPINANLLQAANAGATVRPLNQPWIPGGAPTTSTLTLPAGSTTTTPPTIIDSGGGA